MFLPFLYSSFCFGFFANFFDFWFLFFSVAIQRRRSGTTADRNRRIVWGHCQYQVQPGPLSAHSTGEARNASGIGWQSAGGSRRVWRSTRQSSGSSQCEATRGDWLVDWFDRFKRDSDAFCIFSGISWTIRKWNSTDFGPNMHGLWNDWTNCDSVRWPWPRNRQHWPSNVLWIS